MHSASQPSIYGLPMNGGTHLHFATPSSSMQIAFFPQGISKQGSGTWGGGARNEQFFSDIPVLSFFTINRVAVVLMFLTCTALIRISNGVSRTIARRYPVRVAFGSWSTRIRITLVGLWHATSDRIRTFDISWQTGAFRKTVVQNRALSVRSAGRWLARVGR